MEELLNYLVIVDGVVIEIEEDKVYWWVIYVVVFLNWFVVVKKILLV